MSQLPTLDVPLNMSSVQISSVSTIQCQSLQDSNGKCEKSEVIKSYKRRFWMLLLYSILAVLSGMLFPQHISMANVTGCYYNVSQSAVNWTTQIYMAVYIVCVIPASFLMNYLDIRRTLICASTLNTIACALQFLTLKQTGFPFVMLCCFIGSLSNMLVISLPPYLAARWFPSNELSRACAFGFFGNQIAVSAGLMFTPLLVSSNCNMKHEIMVGKRNIASILTGVNIAILLLVIFTFQNKPKIPPNAAQLQLTKKVDDRRTLETIKKLIRNPNFILIFILSGLMAGGFYAFTTNANNLMIRFFPGKEVEISWMTTVFTVMGIGGSVISGYILDYTHKFKETTLVYCVMSLLSFLAFSGLLYVKTLWIMFIPSALFGFFLSGFLPVGLEYGIEIAFPESEMINSNLQFWSMQVFGIISVQITSILLDIYGFLPSNAAMCAILIMCISIASFLTRNYLRYKNSEVQTNGGS